MRTNKKIEQNRQTDKVDCKLGDSKRCNEMTAEDVPRKKARGRERGDMV